MDDRQIVQLYWDRNVEQEIDRKELVNAINDFLATLSSDKRNIFVCRYWYFDSISDIGGSFNMTENNVSVTLNRLRFKLQRLMHLRQGKSPSG